MAKYQEMLKDVCGLDDAAVAFPEQPRRGCVQLVAKYVERVEATLNAWFTNILKARLLDSAGTLPIVFCRAGQHGIIWRNAQWGLQSCSTTGTGRSSWQMTLQGKALPFKPEERDCWPSCKSLCLIDNGAGGHAGRSEAGRGRAAVDARRGRLFPHPERAGHDCQSLDVMLPRVTILLRKPCLFLGSIRFGE